VACIGTKCLRRGRIEILRSFLYTSRPHPGSPLALRRLPVPASSQHDVPGCGRRPALMCDPIPRPGLDRGPADDFSPLVHSPHATSLPIPASSRPPLSQHPLSLCFSSIKHGGPRCN
jgi:hypothetical protein